MASASDPDNLKRRQAYETNAANRLASMIGVSTTLPPAKCVRDSPLSRERESDRVCDAQKESYRVCDEQSESDRVCDAPMKGMDGRSTRSSGLGEDCLNVSEREPNDLSEATSPFSEESSVGSPEPTNQAEKSPFWTEKTQKPARESSSEYRPLRMNVEGNPLDPREKGISQKEQIKREREVATCCRATSDIIQEERRQAEEGKRYLELQDAARYTPGREVRRSEQSLVIHLSDYVPGKERSPSPPRHARNVAEEIFEQHQHITRRKEREHWLREEQRQKEKQRQAAGKRAILAERCQRYYGHARQFDKISLLHDGHYIRFGVTAYWFSNESDQAGDQFYFQSQGSAPACAMDLITAALARQQDIKDLSHRQYIDAKIGPETTPTEYRIALSPLLRLKKPAQLCGRGPRCLLQAVGSRLSDYMGVSTDAMDIQDDQINRLLRDCDDDIEVVRIILDGWEKQLATVQSPDRDVDAVSRWTQNREIRKIAFFASGLFLQSVVDFLVASLWGVNSQQYACRYLLDKAYKMEEDKARFVLMYDPVDLEKEALEPLKRYLGSNYAEADWYGLALTIATRKLCELDRRYLARMAKEREDSRREAYASPRNHEPSQGNYYRQRTRYRYD